MDSSILNIIVGVILGNAVMRYFQYLFNLFKGDDEVIKNAIMSFAMIGIMIISLLILLKLSTTIIIRLQKNDPYNIRDFELRLINKRFEMQFNEDDIIEKAKGVNFVEKCDSSKV